MPLIVSGSEGQTIYGTGSIVTENKQGEQKTEMTGSVIVSGSLLITGSLEVSGNTIYNYGNLYNMPTATSAGDVSGSGEGRFVKGLYTAGDLGVSGSLYFGSEKESLIVYRETGDDKLVISGSNPAGLVLSGSGITIGGHENGITPPYTTVKGGMAVTNMLTHLGDLSGSGKIFNVGGIQTQGTVGVTGSILIRGGSIILGTMSGSGKFINVGGVETAGNLGVTGSATIRNSLVVGKIMAGGPNIQFTGSTEFTGSVRIPHADTAVLNALHGMGSPTTGQIYYNISTNKLNFYNGSGWSVVSVD